MRCGFVHLSNAQKSAEKRVMKLKRNVSVDFDVWFLNFDTNMLFPQVSHKALGVPTKSAGAQTRHFRIETNKQNKTKQKKRCSTKRRVAGTTLRYQQPTR